jgi:SH3-like domain-containing protein
MKTALTHNILSALAGLFFLLIFSLACGIVEPKENINLALTSVAATIASGSSNDQILPTLAPTPSQAPTATPKTEPCKAESRVNSVNLRRGPSGDIIGCCLSAGEDVEIQKVDEKDEWALIEGIERPSHQGWVKLSLLNITGDCELVSATQ